jgi:RND family efflux transporter MFP subunit
MKNVMIPIAAFALLAACNTKTEQLKTPGEKATPVSAVEVKKEKVVADLRYSGIIEAFQTIPLTFESTGTVEKVLADAGDEVKKGQLLATVDATDANNMYQITLAKYQQAKDAYDRLKEVYEKGSLSEIKWVEMETNLEQAKSSLEISKNNLAKCNLYSPVNGLVGKRNIEPGMYSLSIGSSPFELVDIKQVYVKISVPENEISKITKGMKASFSVSALDRESFEGIISNISPVADKISRTYEAKVKVDNSGQSLKPGMVCDVKLEQTTEKELVLIPYHSVSIDENENAYVFVIDQNTKRVKKHEVKTGQYYGTDLEIVSGLAQRQLIVNEGKEKLSDNSLIAL